tara:strand:- start:2919 stop:4187 length:1269 start_codon:yes stop_codon:yes gene_type:complete
VTLFRMLSSPAVWALGDQVLVSAGTFAMTLLVARCVSLGDFSTYGLTTILLWFVSAIHRSYLTQPMSISAVAEPPEAWGPRLKRVLVLQALGWPLVLGLFLAVSARYLPSWQVAASASLFTIAYLLQETMRRILFVQQRMQWVSCLDALAYGGQLILGVVLWWLHDTPVALSTLLVAASVPFLLSAMLAYASLPTPARAALWPDRQSLKRAASAHWTESRWVCFSQVFMFGSFMLVPFQIAEWGKPLWVAQYNAAGALLNGLNVIRQALGNHLPIEAARRFHSDGVDGLQRYLWTSAVWIFGLSLAIMAILVGFGEPLVGLLFGDRFTEAVALLPHAAVGQLMTMFMLLSQAGALVIKRTEQIFWSYVVGTMISFGLAPWVIPEWGLLGAVWVANIGIFVPAAWHLLAFLRDLRQVATEQRT